MGLHTYTAKVGDRSISIKSFKHTAESIARTLKEPLEVKHHFVELCGVKGVNEATSNLWSPFTTHPVENEELYQSDLKAYIAGLPELITHENAQEVIQQVRAFMTKHTPVVDNRRTAQDEIVRQAEQVTREVERQADKDEWRAIWCKPDLVAIPAGMVGVYLATTYNDSDSMTDYFHPHAQHGDSMLLAIVPKQPERESLARRILARYPELNKLDWKWETENYSMGHGNYLISEVFSIIELPTYDRTNQAALRYEIEFTRMQEPLWCYRDYPGTVEQSPEPVKSEGVTIRRNEQYNGIEVIFPAKPTQSTLEALKALGLRWSQRQGLWYAKHSEALLAKVTLLINPV